MSSQCEHTRLSLGAYALGALEPAEQQLVERHLASCPDCTAEADELAGVVPALATVSAEDVSAQTPSPDLFARIVSAIDSPTPAPAARKPKRWLVAVAASVALLVGAGISIGVSLISTPAASTTASARSGDVRLQVTARDAPTGTQLTLIVGGLPRNEHCQLVASAADGSHHDAGSWNATYSGEARLTESTDVPRNQLRQLTLYGSTGKSLVTVDI